MECILSIQVLSQISVFPFLKVRSYLKPLREYNSHLIQCKKKLLSPKQCYIQSNSFYTVYPYCSKNYWKSTFRYPKLFNRINQASWRCSVCSLLEILLFFLQDKIYFPSILLTFFPCSKIAKKLALFLGLRLGLLQTFVSSVDKV